MAAEWGGKGADTHVEVLDGLDHFTMLDPLADKDSAMVRRLAALATTFTVVLVRWWRKEPKGRLVK